MGEGGGGGLSFHSKTGRNTDRQTNGHADGKTGEQTDRQSEKRRRRVTRIMLTRVPVDFVFTRFMMMMMK